jgi:hypothetical protein
MKNFDPLSSAGPRIHRLADIPFIYSQPTRTPLLYRLRVIVWRFLHAACTLHQPGRANERFRGLM